MNENKHFSVRNKLLDLIESGIDDPLNGTKRNS